LNQAIQDKQAELAPRQQEHDDINEQWTETKAAIFNVRVRKSLCQKSNAQLTVTRLNTETLSVNYKARTEASKNIRGRFMSIDKDKLKPMVVSTPKRSPSLTKLERNVIAPEKT
jgi:ribosomal protein L29